MTSLESRNLYKKLHRGVNKYPIAPMSPKPKILKMQFLLKRSKMGSIFLFEAAIDEKTWKNSYFLLLFQTSRTSCGTCFLGRCMTKPHVFESICKSDSRIESIFELFRENCIDIGRVWGSWARPGTQVPPYEDLRRGFLTISSHIWPT